MRRRKGGPALWLMMVALPLMTGCAAVEKDRVADLQRIDALAVTSTAYVAVADEPLDCSAKDRVCARLWAHHANACLRRGDQAAGGLDAAAQALRARADACALDASARAQAQLPPNAGPDAIQVLSVRAEALTVHRGLASDAAEAARANDTLLETASQLRTVTGGGELASLFEADAIIDEASAGRASIAGSTPCEALRRARAELPTGSFDASITRRAQARERDLTFAVSRVQGCTL